MGAGVARHGCSGGHSCVLVGAGVLTKVKQCTCVCLYVYVHALRVILASATQASVRKLSCACGAPRFGTVSLVL